MIGRREKYNFPDENTPSYILELGEFSERGLRLRGEKLKDLKVWLNRDESPKEKQKRNARGKRFSRVALGEQAKDARLSLEELSVLRGLEN
jgi:hypothetical protein